MCLHVVDSKSIRPSQRRVDERNSIAAVSPGPHDDRWTVPVRPKQVAVDQYQTGKTRIDGFWYHPNNENTLEQLLISRDGLHAIMDYR